MARTEATGPFLLRSDLAAIPEDRLNWTWRNFYRPAEWTAILGRLDVSSADLSESDIESAIMATIWEGIHDRRGSAAERNAWREEADALRSAADYIRAFRSSAADGSSIVDGDWIRVEYEAACAALQALSVKLERLTEALQQHGDDHRSRDIGPRLRFFNEVARLWNSRGYKVDMGAEFRAFVEAAQAPFDPRTHLARPTIVKHVARWRERNGFAALRGPQRQFYP